MVVRMRHTRSHTKNRRSHHALAKPALGKDAAGNAYMRHRMNPTTGKYKDRQVLDMGAKALKRAKKVSAKTAR
ncbi:MAG: ribosomal protein [Parcubacteria group bacterium]|nr:ribosomal protein [Parcubacteria group bacterium]